MLSGQSLSGGCAPGFSGSFKRRGRPLVPEEPARPLLVDLEIRGDPSRPAVTRIRAGPRRAPGEARASPRIWRSVAKGCAHVCGGAKADISHMTLASRRMCTVVSSCAYMRASADKARRSSRPGDRRCLPIRRRSAPFPGSARRASQPISQGAQSHTTPPPQQQQQPQQQPLFGRDELRIRLSCI